MPDSGKYPHDKQVADPFAGTCAVAAKWNIDVGLKPLSKCNMPAPPEFCHACGEIGVHKVYGKLKTKHSAQTCCHQGITIKIKVNLERICIDSKPCKRRGDTFISDRAQHLPTDCQTDSPESLLSQVPG